MLEKILTQWVADERGWFLVLKMGDEEKSVLLKQHKDKQEVAAALRYLASEVER